jgi:hypothetical protein
VATVLLVAITLIAGAALFGYVNAQAAGSENKLGAANAGNVNFLNERFVVPQVAYAYTSSTTTTITSVTTSTATLSTGKVVTLYIYNNGELTDSFSEIEVFCSQTLTGASCRSTMDLTYYYHTGHNFVMDNNQCFPLVGGQCKNPAYNVTANTSPAIETPLLGPESGLPSLSVPVGSTSYITLELPSFSAGAYAQSSTYDFNLLGTYGNTLLYFQVM